MVPGRLSVLPGEGVDRQGREVGYTERNHLKKVMIALYAKLPRSLQARVRQLIGTRQQRALKRFYAGNGRFTPDLADFPPMVMLDTTTSCNLACAHCPNSVLSSDQEWMGDMNVDIYKKIVDEVAAKSKNTIVRPFNSGEPLLRKDIEDLIRYAKDRGIEFLSLNTNGLLLTPRRIESLLACGLDHIEVSMDAFSPETYLAVRRSKHYQKLVDNTLNLLEARKRYPNFTVTVSFVKQADNIHEVDAFRTFWETRVDNVYFREFHQHNELVDDHGHYTEKPEERRHPCPYLWDRIIIQHDGTVRFCEADWKAAHAIGDVREQTLEEIWKGERYQALRESHINGEFDHPFCQKCTDWKEIRWPSS